MFNRGLKYFARLRSVFPIHPLPTDPDVDPCPGHCVKITQPLGVPLDGPVYNVKPASQGILQIHRRGFAVRMPTHFYQWLIDKSNGIPGGDAQPQEIGRAHV